MVSSHGTIEEKRWEYEPVVKNLAAENVSPNAPAVLVALLSKPVVAEDLGVEVVRFERGVVNPVRSSLGKKEDVVVYFLIAPI